MPPKYCLLWRLMPSGGLAEFLATSVNPSRLCIRDVGAGLAAGG